MKNIVKGTKTTYLDEAVKAKKWMPAAHYKVAGDLVNKKKQLIYQNERKTIAADIERQSKRDNYPAANKYDAKYETVHRKNSSCLNFKGERVSFVNDAEHKATTGPDYHKNINFEMTRKRAPSAKYHPISETEKKKGPAFLRGETAAKLISPVTYNQLESF